MIAWGAALAVGAIFIALAMYVLPARTRIVIDTPTSTARAEMRPRVRRHQQLRSTGR